MKTFLIIQTASIGDVILATPVLEKLHDFFPEAKIDFLLKKGNESLFYGHPFLNEIIIWDKSEEKYKNMFRVGNYIRDKKYDVVVNLQRFASTGFLTVYSGAKLKIGFNKNPFSLLFNQRIKHTIRKGNVHEIYRNQRMVEKITDNKTFSVKLYPSQKDFARMSQYKTVKYITISPASLWFTKQYPEEKWIEFINSFKEEIQIYFLGAPNDKGFCEQIIQKSAYKKAMILAGKLSFLESAALMKDAAMNFMNDSAPLHLASSVNAKETAIFCSTVLDFGFGPLSEDKFVVQTKELLNCRPCGLHGLKQCPEKHFKCALTIDNKELLNRIK